jgi:hypothetical protein
MPPKKLTRPFKAPRQATQKRQKNLEKQQDSDLEKSRVTNNNDSSTDEDTSASKVFFLQMILLPSLQ